MGKLIREPDLPPPLGAYVREIIQLLDRELRELQPERDERIDQLIYLGPTEQVVLVRDLVSQLADQCRAFRRGNALRRPSPAGWQGAAASGSDGRLIARFTARHGDDAAPVVRAALAAHDDLMKRAAFGLSRISRERFVRLNLEAAGFAGPAEE